MRCDYCYYLEKDGYYPAGRRVMDPAMLEKFVSGFIASQNTPDVLFNCTAAKPCCAASISSRLPSNWQKKYGKGHRIINTIQTNGTLLDEPWCDFFREHGFLVGISLDGPEDCHDRYRKTAGGGKSFQSVMQGLELLKSHRVEFNILCAVNDYNARRPLETYEFFKSTGARFVQFTPVVERMSGNGGCSPGTSREMP